MTANPKISVILPTHNGALFLSDSIDSILAQTFDDFELIVVDDCSDDNTADILNAYAQKDNRIRIITNTVNQKLPASLNIGFASAKGQYLTWTSDDNRYLPNAFDIMVKTLDNNPITDFVYADMRTIDEAGHIKKTVRLKQPTMLYHGCCIGACFMYRRMCYDTFGGYDEHLFCAEDYEYWMRLYTAGIRFQKINECLYEYRDNSSSLTATKQQQIQQKTLEVKLAYWHIWSQSSYIKTVSLFKQFKRLQDTDTLRKILAVSPIWGRLFYGVFMMKQQIGKKYEKA